ncbi:Fc.00g005470.m01.CDS01 [Cosmosporella sp. VM-42]
MSSLLSNLRLVNGLLFILLASASAAKVTTTSQQSLHSPDPSDESSQRCYDALWDDVHCPHTFVKLYETMASLFKESDLEALCTQTCYISLLVHRDAVRNECPQEHLAYEEVPRDSVYEVPILAEQGIFSWKFACLKTSDGEWCNALGSKNHPKDDPVQIGEMSEDCMAAWRGVMNQAFRDEL